MKKIVTMSYNFRKATPSEIPQIWDILQKAIARRKKMEVINGRTVIKSRRDTKRH
jgi:hypothetical protein